MKPLWTPRKDFIDQSNLRQYQLFLIDQYNLSFKDYEALWAWTAQNPAEFWKSLWSFFDIIEHTPYLEVMNKTEMPGIQWFEGSMINYSEHLFRHMKPDVDVLVFVNEKEEIHSVKGVELEKEAGALRAFLKDQGVSKGDRVAAYLPNIPEAIIAFMAVNSLGAIWSCCSMDFGWNTVVDRFAQIQPKIFISADGYYYKGKDFPRIGEVNKLVQSLPSVEKTLLISHLGLQEQFQGLRWKEVIQKYPNAPLSFDPVPFDHPIWILYSSGTTGKPKAITHSHGGMLLEHLKYMHFHNDVKPGERYFWFTTTGWMMWNFLQSSLLAGAVPVLYEGSPAYPDLDVLWRFAERLPIHHFGTSAPYLTALLNQDLKIGENFNLTSLRSIGSTGSPLPPAAFEYVYERISASVWLCSMSGGTDVCTAFVGGIPSKPVYQGRIQGRALGCSLKALDDHGLEVKNQLGEMVIDKPMPCMPIFFWNDPQNERYKQAYFNTFPGKWRHGDFIEIFDDGSLTIHGRSDATLNRKGIRIGTAEIYNALDQIPEIVDALVLNIEKPGGGDVMPLFVVLASGLHLDNTIRKKINRILKHSCSPRHIPDHILQAPDIPYTLSGKKMEVPVKKLFIGGKYSNKVNREAVRNPSAMDYFIDLAGKIGSDFS